MWRLELANSVLPEEGVREDQPTTNGQRKGRWLQWAAIHRDLLALTFLTVIALIPRLYRIGSAPEGLNADELFNAVDALSLGPGSWQVYFEGNFGREALFLYLMAIPLNLFGQEVWALRLPAVLLGTGSTLLCYMVGKQAFNRRVGFIGGALLAVSLWPIMQSRWGLRAVSLTFFTALTVYLYGRVIRRDKPMWAGWIAAGIMLGLTTYTYIPGRLFPLVIGAWLAIAALLQKGWLQRRWPQLLLSLLVALIVYAPFGIYSIRNPEKVDQRVSGLWDLVNLKVEEDPQSILESVASVPLMFSFSGDDEGRYHVPDRPVFDPVTSLFFYLGIAVSLWLSFKNGGNLVRRSAYGLLLVWMAIMLAPNLVVGKNTSFLRGAGAIVPIYLVAGIGLDFLFASMRHRWPGKRRLINWSMAAVVLLGLLITLIESWQTYSNIWLNLPDAREAWHADLGLLGQYLSEHPADGGMPVFAAYDYVLDATPQIFEYNSDDYVIWYDNQSAFAWRPRTAASRYITTAGRPVHPAALEHLSELSAGQRVEFSNGDLAFTVFEVDPSSVNWQPMVSQPVEFAGGPAVLGYDLPSEVFRGDSISLATHWEIPEGREGLPNKLTFIQARLKDSAGNVWSQAEGLIGYPQKGWKEGDRFVQFMDLEIPSGMPPGPAALEFEVRDWDGSPYPAREVLQEDGAGTGTGEGTLIVRSRPASDIAMVGDVPLFDGTLALLDSTFSTLIAPGLPLDLSLDWFAVKDPQVDYLVQLQLTSPSSAEPILEQRSAMWPALYPPTEWQAGEQVTTFHRFKIPLDIETIDNPVLRIQLLDPKTSVPVPLDQGVANLAELSWSLREHSFTAPKFQNALSVIFGDSIELLGYDLNAIDRRPGGEIELTLYWRAIQTPDQAYTVFNHLVGSDGQFRGQFDSPPFGDAWLTSTWLPGEVVVDRRIIPIEAGATEGPVKLVIGLYSADDVVRLPVFLEGEPLPGDQLEIGELEIIP